jgi:predicted HTH domain antitoxin
VHLSPEQVLKEIVIVELYRRRQVSSGKAAELLDMERFEFVRYISRLGIPFFDMSEEEFAEEVLAVKNGA